MANGPGPVPVFKIEEDVPNGLRVELRGPDLPFGFPRAVTAFEQGGTLEHERVYLPGRERPIIQVLQARERDLVIHGAFRDHLWATEVGSQSLTHAREQKRALEQIRRRGNALRISWSQERWTGVLVEALFAVEGPHDIGYSLTFAVVEMADTPPATPASTPQQRMADLGAALQAALTEQRASVSALRLRATAITVQADLEAALDLAIDAVEDMTAACARLESATGSAATSEANRVDGTGRNASLQMAAVVTRLTNLPVSTMVPDGDPGTAAQWQSAQFGTLATCTEGQDTVRTIRQAARARVRKASRLYAVQQGDTLESIARTQLGDAARAGELGLRADQVQVGRYVRIPES